MGLMIKEGAELDPIAPGAKIVIHESSKDATNLWGALNDVPRDLSGIRHFTFSATHFAVF